MIGRDEEQIDMVSRKRQRVEEDQGYTQGPLDETFGQHSAFPIEQDDDSDVMKYLTSVRQEAESDRCVYFVERKEEEATEDEIGEATMQAVEDIVVGEIELHEAIQWRDNLLHNFLSLKDELKTHISRINQAHNLLVDPLPQTAVAWRKLVFQNTPPTVDLLFNSVDHSTTIKLLIYCTHWLSINIPENLSKWIYMLFLRLENILDHSEVSIVRDLAKKAIKLREKENLTSISKYTMDMVISVVGIYYRQRDLLVYVQS